MSCKDSLLHTLIKIPKTDKHAQRVNEKDFYVPNYSEYNLVIKHNYTVNQLKKICKYYKLNVSGNKKDLINKIYSNLYFSKFAIVIQKYMYGFLIRKWCESHGPAYIKRSICTNSSDFFTMQEVKNIPINQFFSYKDKDNFIYGFNIISLYALYKNGLNNKDSPKNPYNRNEIPNTLLEDVESMVKLSKLLNFDVQIEIEKDNIDEKKQLELRILSLFQYIDSLGNYSNISWFTNLSREKLYLFLRELYDIWHYRAQLSSTIKREIAPPIGDPFRCININNLHQLSFEGIKKKSISIMEILVKNGVNHDSQVLGANYVLCALTLVCVDAAITLPWLYQSVAHTI